MQAIILAAGMVKSISESYGVPGFRLGVLASGDFAVRDRKDNSYVIKTLKSL